jgi:hypothetical protein
MKNKIIGSLLILPGAFLILSIFVSIVYLAIKGDEVCQNALVFFATMVALVCMPIGAAIIFSDNSK